VKIQEKSAKTWAKSVKIFETFANPWKSG